MSFPIFHQDILKTSFLGRHCCRIPDLIGGPTDRPRPPSILQRGRRSEKRAPKVQLIQRETERNREQSSLSLPLHCALALIVFVEYPPLLKAQPSQALTWNRKITPSRGRKKTLYFRRAHLNRIARKSYAMLTKEAIFSFGII